MHLRTMLYKCTYDNKCICLYAFFVVVKHNAKCRNICHTEQNSEYRRKAHKTTYILDSELSPNSKASTTMPRLSFSLSSNAIVHRLKKIYVYKTKSIFRFLSRTYIATADNILFNFIWLLYLYHILSNSSW